MFVRHRNYKNNLAGIIVEHVRAGSGIWVERQIISDWVYMRSFAFLMLFQSLLVRDLLRHALFGMLRLAPGMYSTYRRWDVTYHIRMGFVQRTVRFRGERAAWHWDNTPSGRECRLRLFTGQRLDGRCRLLHIGFRDWCSHLDDDSLADALMVKVRVFDTPVPSL